MCFHALLQQQVKGAGNIPLHFRCGAKTHPQDGAALFEALHALHLQRRPDVVAHHRVLAQLLGGLLHQGNRIVDFHIVRNANTHQRNTELAGHIVDRFDTTEGDDVQHAVQVTQPHGAQC